MVEAKFNAGYNEAGGIAEIMADAIMDHNVDGAPLGDKENDGIG